MDKPQALKRRNHTVPRFHLLRFSDDGQLTRVELRGKKRISVSVKDASVVKDFYIAQKPDGTWTDEIESLFSQIESNAAAATRRVVDERMWPIGPDERGAIAAWASLQYLRVPAVRQLGLEIAEEFRAVGVTVRDKSDRKIILKMDDAGYDEVTHPNLHMNFILKQLLDIAGMLIHRRWILTRYRLKSLATSDSPVALIAPPDYPDHLGVGIANAGAVYMPLDRRVGLTMTAEDGSDILHAGAAKTALWMNDVTAKNARKYLYHHPQDDPFGRLDLPPPRDRELTGHESAGQLIEHLFQ